MKDCLVRATRDAESLSEVPWADLVNLINIFTVISWFLWHTSTDSLEGAKISTKHTRLSFGTSDWNPFVVEPF